jgi:hypothetical protein
LDVVQHLGSSWVAISKTAERPGLAASWQLMAARGQDGLSGSGGGESSSGSISLGTANGLSLAGSVLSLGLASGAVAGAMAAADKTKLDAITGTNTGDATIGTANGLSVVGQAFSLALAIAGGANGAFSGTDKTKLDAITGTHTGTNTGDVSIGTANGLSLVGQALSLAAADGSNAGALTAGAQTIGGVKTLSAALVLSSTGTFAGTFFSPASDLGGHIGRFTSETGGGARCNIVGSLVDLSQASRVTWGAAALNTYVGLSANSGTNTNHLFKSSTTLSGNTTIAQFSNDNGAVVVEFAVHNSGKPLYPNGSDSSGSPGAATINAPSGISAIAASASSVVITNSAVSATDRILITPLDLDTTLLQFKAVAGSGSFTVTGNATATATWKFGWLVVGTT